MYLKKDNLAIRAALPDDAELLCRWWNDGDVMAHAGFPRGLGITEEEIADKINTDTYLSRRLILEVDGVPVGEMNYKTVSEGTAAIGIKICERDKRGKGCGTAFLKMLIGYLFDEMGYRKIVLDTNVNNTRARHVYEKIGFRRVGIRKDAWKDQVGEWQSFVDYALAREEE